MCEGDGTPLTLLLTEAQVGADAGAKHDIGPQLPGAATLIADRGCGAGWLQEALRGCDSVACIPPRAHRVAPIACGAGLHTRRILVDRMVGAAFVAETPHWGLS